MRKRRGFSRRRAFSSSENRSVSRNCWIRLRDCSVEINYSVLEHTNTFELDFDHISGFHEYLGVSDETDTTWCSGRNNVSDLQSHHLGNVGNQFRHLEDHVSSIRLLHRLSVQLQFDAKPISIAERIPSHKVWSYG